MANEAVQEARRRVREEKRLNRYAKYRNDPVGFGEKALGASFTDSVKELMLSVRDNPVTIAQSANGTGKTHSAAHIAAWFYKVYPEAQIYTTAAPPMDNLRRLLWGELLNIHNKNKQVFDDDSLRAMEIYRNSRSFIAGVAIPTSGDPAERQAKFAGKHAPQLLFIVDEGDGVPDEVYKGIESCMSGGMVRLLILFNPRNKSGPVYRKIINQEANVVRLSAFDHPNVITGKNQVPGAVDREITIRRINKWTRALVPGEKDDTPEAFVVPDYLVGATARSEGGHFFPPLGPGARRVIDPAFDYMVLGRFPSQAEDQLISDEWIHAAVSRYQLWVAQHGDTPPAGISPHMGLDVAERGVDANAAVLRYGGYVAPPITWNGMSVIQVADKAISIYRQYNVGLATVDATGVGSAVAPYMSRQSGVVSFGVHASERPTLGTKTEIGEFYSIRDQLWWAVREWLKNDPGAMLPPDDLLLDELRAMRYSVGDDGRIRMMKKDKMRTLLKRSPDRADALCLTFSPRRKARVVNIGTGETYA